MQVRDFLWETVGKMNILFQMLPLNLSEHTDKSLFHLPISRPTLKQEGHGNLDTPDRACPAVGKWMFHLLDLLAKPLLSLALKLSTSLQGGEVQLQVFSEDGKCVVKKGAKGE